MSKTQRSTLNNLRLAIHGVTAPHYCVGTFDPDKPVAIVFRDGARFEVIRANNPYEQQSALKPLLRRCKRAPFGDGRKTRYDRTVRDALQLKAEQGELSIENFDPEAAGILRTIRRELLPNDPNPIAAELYSVNVYTEGGHFAPHKDTPRGKDMFGTLVVCLPSQFSRGRLVLSHRGIVQKIDWATAISNQKKPTQVHWAAFFGDVDHEIEEIWQGARLTLTYLLRRGDKDLLRRGTKSAPRNESAGAELAPRIQAAWSALLADESFLPRGGILGYPCCHLYHQDARLQRQRSAITRKSSTMLKGRDQLVAATALEAGLKVHFLPYMFEDCADETWQLKWFPTQEEKSRLGWQVDGTDLEEALPIRAGSEDEGTFGVTWLEPRPSSDKSTWQAGAGRDPDLPAAAHLHRCDYCPWGYFGNESSEVDLYTFAALHIDIPKYGTDTRAGVPGAPPLVKRARKTR